MADNGDLACHFWVVSSCESLYTCTLPTKAWVLGSEEGNKWCSIQSMWDPSGMGRGSTCLIWTSSVWKGQASGRGRQAAAGLTEAKSGKSRSHSE